MDDLEGIGVLGCGSSGVVRKVRHRITGAVLAMKVIQMNVQDDQVRKQINRELRALYEASSPHVIKYHQAFLESGAITIVMEYMDGGSLSDVAAAHAALAAQQSPPAPPGIPERELSAIASQVLLGLQYLHKVKRVMHRDIKPSNLLLDRSGRVKITDFGVSGQLANSVSKCVSWVGTITYMSPERISGDKYGYDSDIWSFGLSLVECALGRFPYPDQSQAHGQGQGQGQPKEEGVRRLSFWDLLHYIVENPPPKIPDHFSAEFRDFVSGCLQKAPDKRPKIGQLLAHPFITKYAKGKGTTGMGEGEGEGEGAAGIGGESPELAALVRGVMGPAPGEDDDQMDVN